LDVGGWDFHSCAEAEQQEKIARGIYRRLTHRERISNHNALVGQTKKRVHKVENHQPGNTMIRIHSLSTILALALLAPAFNVAASELDAAVKAALEESHDGPAALPAPVFKLFKHSFAVRPVVLVEKQRSKFTLTGKLARIWPPNGKDDEITYWIIKEKGAVKEITWQINGGERRSVSEPILNALGDYRIGLPMPEEKQNEVQRALEKAVDESWERAAEFLMAHIAVRHC
jgi:hypothetical protein